MVTWHCLLPVKRTPTSMNNLCWHLLLQQRFRICKKHRSRVCASHKSQHLVKLCGKWWSYLIQSHILTSLCGKIPSNAWLIAGRNLCHNPCWKGFCDLKFPKVSRQSDPFTQSTNPHHHFLMVWDFFSLGSGLPCLVCVVCSLSWGELRVPKDSMLLDEDFTSVDADLIFAKVKGRCHGADMQTTCWRVDGSMSWWVGIWESREGKWPVEDSPWTKFAGIWIFCGWGSLVSHVLVFWMV